MDMDIYIYILLFLATSCDHRCICVHQILPEVEENPWSESHTLYRAALRVSTIPCLTLHNVLSPIYQIILALGNYMNSSKRGAVYGFKLQSLDLVSLQSPATSVFRVLSHTPQLIHLNQLGCVFLFGTDRFEQGKNNWSESDSTPSRLNCRKWIKGFIVNVSC